jgi:hypothetical protein
MELETPLPENTRILALPSICSLYSRSISASMKYSARLGITGQRFEKHPSTLFLLRFFSISSLSLEKPSTINLRNYYSLTTCSLKCGLSRRAIHIFCQKIMRTMSPRLVFFPRISGQERIAEPFGFILVLP